MERMVPWPACSNLVIPPGPMPSSLDPWCFGVPADVTAEELEAADPKDGA